MSDEYWATFSIYDQQQAALYRQALLLFDRVVIPVPTKQVGKLTQQQIDQMAQEAIYLESEGAGVFFEWKPEEFYEWQKRTIEDEAVDREMLAAFLQNNPPMATRMQLSNHYQKAIPDLLPAGVESVIALPVYGSLAGFNALTDTIRKEDPYEQMTLEIIMKHLPIPSDDTPLEEILRVRQSEHYQKALLAMRIWQMKTVGELLTNFSERKYKMAKAEFEKGLQDYRDAMKDAGWEKLETGAISLLVVGGVLAGEIKENPLLTALAELASPLFSIKKVIKPSWKHAQHDSFAPAGVIYVAEQELI